MGYSSLRKLILKITPQKIKNIFQEEIKRKYSNTGDYSTLSYSQEGEDLVLSRIFEQKKDGFYVDVGAHHPKRFSNTYLFYKMGWQGINIDANPGSMEEFDKIRPRDLNLERAISDKNEKVRFYIFNEPALNTFSHEEANKKNGLWQYRVIDEIEIQTFRLSELLQEYINSDQRIDFLNIDVEGYDFKVLKSIDWAIHKPSVILIESLNLNLEEIGRSEICQFLKSKSYRLLAKTFNTLIFKIDSE